ncbi:MAG: WecB/TagA/CpsF family glycosyltransferase [Verrucomicrobiaceae bacterium]|nr:MAG: WecB/TagA/CpsF family glycosyltransferase [Verrucomicrobiaceae bacterium]
MVAYSSVNSAARSIAVPREWARDLPPPVVMMGVPFDQVTTPQALGLIEEMIASGRPHMLATANVDFLAQVQVDAPLREILLNTDLVVCDGTPLVWLSRWLGDPLPERVAGSDMVPLLFNLASEKGYRVYFLGGREEVMQLGLKNIRERWPELKIAGAWSPPFSSIEKMDHEGILRRLHEAAPDILLVSFGCPKQEKWIAMNLHKAGIPVSVGVGASIDFIAGTYKRAPMWMRKVGLEWFFRVLQEPKRLAGRYWRDIRIVAPGILRQLWQMRGRGFFQRRHTGIPRSAAESLESPETTVSEPAAPPVELLRLPERLDALSARETELWTAAENTPHDWIIADASETQFIDSTGTGKLVRFARGCRERGGQCILAAPGPLVLQTLALMRLKEYFVIAESMEEALKLVPRTAAQAAAGPVPAPPAAAWESETIGHILEWKETVSAANMTPLETEGFEMLENLPAGSTVIINMETVGFIDSAAVGLMLRLQRRARQRHINLSFVKASDMVRRVLSLLRVENYLLTGPGEVAA